MLAETTLPTPARKRVISHPRQHKIDVAKALKLRLQGATFESIGELMGVSRQAVYNALTNFEPFLRGVAPGELTAYSEHRAELFNRVEQHLSASLLDQDALSKASLNNRAYAFKQIHEARRLESGQSTANVSILGKIITAAEEKLGAQAQPIQQVTGQLAHSPEVRQRKKAKKSP